MLSLATWQFKVYTKVEMNLLKLKFTICVFWSAYFGSNASYPNFSYEKDIGLGRN